MGWLALSQGSRPGLGVCRPPGSGVEGRVAFAQTVAPGGLAPFQFLGNRDGVSASETFRLPWPAMDFVNGLETSLRPSLEIFVARPMSC